MSVFISIIIPFYNVEKYISECLESVFNQDISESEYEVICVDDCSPDGSKAIVNSFRSQHPNLTIISHDRNMKLGAARNTGLDYARGEYVWFVDSDDKLFPNSLGKLVTKCKENNPDILHFRYSTPDGIFPYARESVPHPGKEEFFKPYFDVSFVWNRIYKRSFLISNSLSFSKLPGCDILHTIAAFDKSERYMQVADLCYEYRVDNPESAVHSRMSGYRLFMYTINVGNELLALSSTLSGCVCPAVAMSGEIKINCFHRSLLLMEMKEIWAFYKNAYSRFDVLKSTWHRMDAISKALIVVPPVAFIGQPLAVLAKKIKQVVQN